MHICWLERTCSGERREGYKGNRGGWAATDRRTTEPVGIATGVAESPGSAGVCLYVTEEYATVCSPTEGSPSMRPVVLAGVVVQLEDPLAVVWETQDSEVLWEISHTFFTPTRRSGRSAHTAPHSLLWRTAWLWLS
jgi:hypothetical protein